jgi:acetyl esterase/lipase
LTDPALLTAAHADADADIARLLLVLRLVGRQGVDDLLARRRSFVRFMERLPAPPAPATRMRHLGGIVAEEVRAAGVAAAAPTVLYLHGGGYCLGSVATHRALAARLSAAAGAAVVVPEYRLAPEHPFPAAYDDALTAWRALAASQPGRALAIGGDSAGGGLAVAVAAALGDRERRPAALFALSPWVDLTSTAASIDGHAAQDPLVDRPGLEGMSALYLRLADARDPRASPLFGALRGLPPALVQVGAEECLHDDAVALRNALADAGVPVELEVWPRMVHVWHLYAGIVAAGERAIARVGTFLRTRLAAAALS